MANRFSRLLIAICIPFCGLPGYANAQSGNPLRNREVPEFHSAPTSIPVVRISSPTATQNHNSEMPREVWEAIHNRASVANNFAEQPQNREPIAQQAVAQQAAAQPIVDTNVAQAIHIAEPDRSPVATRNMIPKSDLAPINDMLNALHAKKTNKPDSYSEPVGKIGEPFVGSNYENGGDSNGFGRATALPRSSSHAKSQPQFDRQRFQRLIRQLAINTCIVMCIGVGFILIAKQWFKNKKPSKRSAQTTIQIKSTLRLGPKSNLFLVEAGDHQLVVASDQGGIKSVVPLTDSFAHTYDSLADNNEETTKQLSEAETAATSDGLYSLATVSRPGGQKTNSAKRTQKDSDEEIRSQMEAALSEHGVKDFFQKTVRSQG